MFSLSDPSKFYIFILLYWTVLSLELNPVMVIHCKCQFYVGIILMHWFYFSGCNVQENTSRDWLEWGIQIQFIVSVLLENRYNCRPLYCCKFGLFYSLVEPKPLRTLWTQTLYRSSDLNISQRKEFIYVLKCKLCFIVCIKNFWHVTWTNQ